jgi:hypothetical protein
LHAGAATSGDLCCFPIARCGAGHAWLDAKCWLSIRLKWSRMLRLPVAKTSWRGSTASSRSWRTHDVLLLKAPKAHTARAVKAVKAVLFGPNLYRPRNPLSPLPRPKNKKPTAHSRCGPYLMRTAYALTCAVTSASLRPRAHVSPLRSAVARGSVALADRCAIVVATTPRM